MHDAHAFLLALTIVLGVAAVTTVICQRLKQPVVLGYLLAGLVIGPHVPVPLVADGAIVGTLSELGVILLMFSIGLEFSLSRLAEVGVAAAVTAVIQCSLMAWLGFVTARFFGWTTLEGLFTGAIIAISSTTIIAKAFDEQKIGGNLRKLVVGILIVEDLVGILLMAALTAIASGAGLSARALALTTGRLAAFLVGLLVVGLLVVPRSIRAVVRMNRPETTLVASIGLCFAVALLAQEFGYSVALGAFIAGSLIAESGAEKEVEHLVTPVRDMFAAIFFVSVGMSIDPFIIARHFPEVATLTLVVIVGKIAGVSLGAFLSGSGTRVSVEAGMSLAQIGEFSFIIAALGLSLRATGDFLYPIAVAVSGITTLLTPWLIRGARRSALLVDRLLPRSMQTFASLYGTWVENLRSGDGPRTATSAIRKLFGALVLDGALVAALVIGTSVALADIVAYVGSVFNMSAGVTRPIVIAGAVLLIVPFIIGIARVSRRLGRVLAEAALPTEERGKVDLARAPRRVLNLTLELAIVLLVGIPLVAVTQPFLPGFSAAGILFVLLVALGFVFWKSTADLEGHVRASAQLIVELLAAQAGTGKDEASRAPLDLGDVNLILPGLGAPVPVLIAEGSTAIGKSLAELNLRGATGATVLAITRGKEALVVPAAAETLRHGDVVALAGTKDAIEAAKSLLGCSGRASTPA
ncbi:MAG TPA: cation:proton antiporter [Polyangiaceae bacterium]|nr:cation:proton antiporter [Polyangiaceae bacterium]